MKRLPAGLLIAVFSALMLISASALPAFAAHRGGAAIVAFSADWCASCQSVLPIAQEVAGANGLSVSVIDVDGKDAPHQAGEYGLSIPNSQPPQVYLVHNGRVTLLFDGREYNYGHDDDVRSLMLERLQAVRGR